MQDQVIMDNVLTSVKNACEYAMNILEKLLDENEKIEL